VSLKDYRAKRNFGVSPEPKGDEHPRPSADGARFFCVQKHLASHLHYDFRLEHDGVLLSWAVPKGPSIDPTVKRLAMHVEDHPVEYGTFEGVIPEGYGAGIVMLWDQGTWEPEVGDVPAALRKGDLKFRLNGAKLKGSWVLVRTRGAGERSWLLLKHRDEWSGPLDIAEFAPLSVKGGGDFADILAEDNPSIWTSNRPAKGGDTGAMFARIIERALALKAEREPAPAETPTPARQSRERGAAKRSATRTQQSVGTAKRTVGRKGPPTERVQVRKTTKAAVPARPSRKRR
jgi:bifunctional non-homologous end joining protein LigD